MNRSLLNWGVFLVVLGAIPLAVQAGVIDERATQQLLRLWPLLLVGMGVGLLLRYTRVAAIGGVIVAATAGMLVGALLSGGVGGLAGACAGGDATGEVASAVGTFDGPSATVDIVLSCVGLTVDRGPGNGWIVEARHAKDNPPPIDAATSRLSLRGEPGPVFVPFGADTRRDWRVTLPEAPALRLDVTLNAATASLDLGGGEVEVLNGTFNASDVDARLGGTPSIAGLNLTYNASSGTLSLPPATLSGLVTVNASSLELCLPPGVGLRIDLKATLSSDNFEEAGLTLAGDRWQTTGYADGAQRIDLRIDASVSSLTLTGSGGCP